MSEHSYCQILGLTNTYTQQDLQQAYKSLAKRYHPDKMLSSSNHSDSQLNFIQIKDAYQSLKKINENNKRKQRVKRQLKELFFNYDSESEQNDSEASSQYFTKRDIILSQQFKQIQKYLKNIKEIQDLRDKNMKLFIEQQNMNKNKLESSNKNKRKNEKQSWKLESQTLKQKINKKIKIFDIERGLVF